MLAIVYSKCIQCCIFEYTYPGVDVLLVSLQRVLHCLPTPSFILLWCWMTNSTDSVSECMIKLALSLISSPHIASTLMPLVVILTLLPSTAKGGPPGLVLETVDIQKVQKLSCSLLDNHLCALHCYTTHAITFCTHFDYIFVTMSVIKPYYCDTMPSTGQVINYCQGNSRSQANAELSCYHW